jgi:hydroxyethylthiazole kinase-like uncharacterized protein yjeF
MHIVLSAQEMARVEQLAIADGLSQEAFMQEAGVKVARIVKRWATKGERILLLVGKGNKGGDALAAGWHLLQEGFVVDALMVYRAEESGELNRLMRERFEKRGGKGVSFETEFSLYGVIVDGLLGTGFRGVVEPRLVKVIERANGSHAPLIAIDLPSGLNGTTGEGAESAIQATATVALGCAKSGFFLRSGWNCVGELFIEEFGLPLKYLEMAKRFAELPLASELERPRPLRNRHKYQAGYVLGYGGSKALSGAPKLAALAAFRSGAGIVKLFYPKEAESNMCCCFPELIHAPWDEAAWTHEVTRASAIFVGPGLGTVSWVNEWLRKHLAQVTQPCVVDADALVADFSCLPKKVVLTPHRKEVLRLLGLKMVPSDEELLRLCQQFCNKTEAVLVLKGAPTFILGPQRVLKIIPHGDPGMATAGAGDVLTGVIVSLLAQGLPCWQAAVLGAMLHASAGEKMAKAKSSYGLIASDLIDGLLLVQ